MNNTDIATSPGPLDRSRAQMTTSCNDTDLGTVLPPKHKTDISDADPSLKMNKTLEHQGVKTGGVNVNLRVIYCSNISDKVDFDFLHIHMKQFGHVERIKLCFIKNQNSYDCYVTFSNADSAYKALAEVDGKTIIDSVCTAKLFNVNNVRDDDSDYIPSMFEDVCPVHTIKDDPKLLWHVASYKPGKENFLSGCQLLQKKIGTIPKGNLKRYGKGILIKASNDVQMKMLTKFSPTEDGNISLVSPHCSFNSIKGVVYNRDLYEFEETDILNMCPKYVYKVRKLKGTQNAIELSFSCPSLPEFFYIDHARIWVKPFKYRPTQCYKCFEYGHVSDSCSHAAKCYICSKEYHGEHCNAEKYCFHCYGDHSPNWRGCPQYAFQREVINTAHSNFVSLGEARHLVLGANKAPGATVASVVKKNVNLPQRPGNTSHKNPQFTKPLPSLSVNELRPIAVEAEIHNVLPTLTLAATNPQSPKMSNSTSQVSTSSRGGSSPKAKRTRKSSIASGNSDVSSPPQDKILSDDLASEIVRNEIAYPTELSQIQSGETPHEGNSKEPFSNVLPGEPTITPVVLSINVKSPKSKYLEKIIDKSTPRLTKPHSQEKFKSSNVRTGKSVKGSRLRRSFPHLKSSSISSLLSQSKEYWAGKKA